MDTAIYWIEYVARHKGAFHLRSVGADLSWYQYYLVDVGITLFGILLLSAVITYYLLYYAIKKIASVCKRKQKHKLKNN